MILICKYEKSNESHWTFFGPVGPVGFVCLFGFVNLHPHQNTTNGPKSSLSSVCNMSTNISSNLGFVVLFVLGDPQNTTNGPKAFATLAYFSLLLAINIALAPWLIWSIGFRSSIGCTLAKNFGAKILSLFFAVSIVPAIPLLVGKEETMVVYMVVWLSRPPPKPKKSPIFALPLCEFPWCAVRPPYGKHHYNSANLACRHDLAKSVLS